MSAHTMGVSTLDYNRTAATMNTTGLLFKLYGEHFVGSIPVALTGNSSQPAPLYPIGGDQPKTNSGSPTYPLDMFAALTLRPQIPDPCSGECDGIASRSSISTLPGLRIAGPSTTVGR